MITKGSGWYKSMVGRVFDIDKSSDNGSSYDLLPNETEFWYMYRVAKAHCEPCIKSKALRTTTNSNDEVVLTEGKEYWLIDK